MSQNQLAEFEEDKDVIIKEAMSNLREALEANTRYQAVIADLNSILQKQSALIDRQQADINALKAGRIPTGQATH